MEVYIEYALLENFCVDFMLLSLSSKICAIKIKNRRLILSAIALSVLGVIFPLIPLEKHLAYALKFLVPVPILFLTVWGCTSGLKTRIRLHRAAFFNVAFLVMSFAYAGALIAVFDLVKIEYTATDGGFVLTKIPVGCSVLGLCAFWLLLKKCIARVYAKKTKNRFIYPCKIRVGKNEKHADCFLDSGNIVKADGVPVCFVSAHVFFDLRLGQTFLDGKRIKISTMSGEKYVDAYLADEMEIYFENKKNKIEKVYFSLSNRLIGREYQILVGAWAVDGL